MTSLAEPANYRSSHDLSNKIVNQCDDHENDSPTETDTTDCDQELGSQSLDINQDSKSLSPTKSIDSALEKNLKGLDKTSEKEVNYDTDTSESDDEARVGLNYEDYDENFCPKNIETLTNSPNHSKEAVEHESSSAIENSKNESPYKEKDKNIQSNEQIMKIPESKSQRFNPFNTSNSPVSTERMPTLLSSYDPEPNLNSANDIEPDPQFELMPAKQKELNTFNEQIADLQKVIKEVKIKTQSPINSYNPIPVSSISSPWVKQNIPNTPTNSDIPTNSLHNESVSSESIKDKTNDKPQNGTVEKTVPHKDNHDSGSSASGGSEVVYVPGPCEPEDLIDGIIFTANYLGSTQLMSEKNPAKNSRMFQAQEAVNRIKAPDGEHQPSVEVDLFISTAKVKVLNADTQETMMEHFLRSISYIADIGELLVIMAKRRPPRADQEDDEMIRVPKQEKRNRIICHVFSSPDAHLMAQAIGQAFNVAYQQFLRANGIEPQALTQDDFNTILDTQEMYHDDLVHYSKQENVKELWIEKAKGEGMGIVVVESGWGSILPTVVLANMQHGSAVERSGKMSIGDQIMAINSTSLVGLPLQTCHSIIKGLKNHTLVKVNIVSCPPVVTVLIKRPDLKYQLGFSVQNGIICSLMRGGIAERGGVRVGHRIIEINSQSVVATPHDKIVQMLVTSVGEIQMKTMPAAMYRLLTGQEQPLYI